MRQKICLVYPQQTKLPSEWNKVTNIAPPQIPLPPLGLLYIIANSKHEIDFIDNRIQKLSIPQLVEATKHYDFVGFGGTIFEANEAIQTSKQLMSLGIKTIYGGANATVNPELYTNNFTYIFRGEADLEFDNFISNPKPIYTAKRITNLDQIKFPAREKIDLSKYYRQNEYLTKYPIDTVVTSRGCPFDCAFCSSKWLWERRFTARSTENIMKEIEFLIQNHGTKGFYFREDNFTVNRNRVIDFCNAIKKYQVEWVCESRVDTVDKELLTLMKSAGLKGIWFGIESTRNDHLKLMNKGITIEKAKETINICKELGIKCGGGFIIGLPWETESDMLSTGTEARKFNLDIVFFNRLYAIPKSQVHSIIITEKLKKYETDNIILANTRTVDADRVTQIYYDTAYPKQVKILRLLKPLVPIIKKFPRLHKLAINIYSKMKTKTI